LDIAMMALSLLLIIVAMVNFNLHKSYKFLLMLLTVTPAVAVAVWWGDGLNDKDVLFKYPWWILFLRIVCVSIFAIVLTSIMA